MRNNAYHLEDGDLNAPLPKDFNTMNSDLAEFRDLSIAAKANKKVTVSSRMASKNNSASKRSPKLAANRSTKNLNVETGNKTPKKQHQQTQATYEHLSPVHIELPKKQHIIVKV